MTADTPTPAEIAARLSPAQKKALLWLQPDRLGDSFSVRHRRVTLAILCGLQVARYIGCGAYRLTPLGLAVRAELERMEARDGE